MATNQTMTQDELGDILDEFAHHWPHRHVIDSVSLTTARDGVTFTAVNGSKCYVSRNESFDTAFDIVANWTRTMAKKEQQERSRFAAFESAALEEW